MDINKNQLNRCPFAIISHPDAGKTTITEKLLWFGQMIRTMGMVKSKSGNFAKSDWMEMEKQRGISISSSVMTFDYNDRHVHLLDTPGHKDFSEDTFRTLTAVESVLMMIDSAKGVEEQTIKLMEVSRLRDTPIVTFMNKFDRESLSPFELIDNVEKICSIQCCPITWPIGSGVDFKGVLHLKSRKIFTFEESSNPFEPKIVDASDLDSPELVEFIGENNLEQLKEDLELIEMAMPEFHLDEFLAGIQTPVFFGTALYNFGVKEVLDFLTTHGPGPKERKALLPPFDETAESITVSPEEEEFSGVVFKVQANMDKNHRDRMSFIRICSGSLKRGDKVHLVRTGKDIKVSTPVIFRSQDREITDEAFAGDIIGINGPYQIGDTFTKGRKIQFTGIPLFAPEIFKKFTLKNAMKGKHLEKGLTQLSEEGAVQLFTPYSGTEKILGAVGALQFEVVKYRLENEYDVVGDFHHMTYEGVRWVIFPNENKEKEFIDHYNFSGQILRDRHKRICFAFRSPFELQMAKDKYKEVEFYANSELQLNRAL